MNTLTLVINELKNLKKELDIVYNDSTLGDIPLIQKRIDNLINKLNK